MPPLDNSKWEIFAQECAAGKTADEAYVLAGYEENRCNASRLKTKENIRQRIAELQAIAAISAEVTIESLLREAADIQRLAVAAGQYAAANGSMTIRAKLSGHWVDKTDNTNTNTNVNPNDVSDAEIATVLKGSGSVSPAAKANGKAVAH